MNEKTYRRLIRWIVKLWKRRNYYKFWYEYEKDSNNVWRDHFQSKDKDK